MGTVGVVALQTEPACSFRPSSARVQLPPDAPRRRCGCAAIGGTKIYSIFSSEPFIKDLLYSIFFPEVSLH
ncbi:hypothetical protein NDU88_010602 [Pleurodeles waltl]|uniref:Uncharacterized protein n=1 Tax=Pleurodeles waltl TaxID=8319 RepID=A0AAV7PVC6_PLEWA|nr:hypothetical protein NDU88_010602 [Pleurodeles waltl]